MTIETQASGGYFVTEEQEKLARYDARQRGLELQKHLATLKGQIARNKDAWKKLGDALDAVNYHTFKVENGEICVLTREGATMRKATAIALSHFDPESLTRFLADLEETKQALEAISKQCREMGDPLP